MDVLDRAGQRDTVYWNFVYQPLPDADGRISGITVVATDVTEQVLARRRLEHVGQELAANYATLHTAHGASQVANEALSHSNAQLTYANQDLDNFVYAASHDLKLPVLNLAGLFDELRRGVSFTDAAEEALLVPLITQALHQLSTSLDDLAALGRAQQAAHAPAEPMMLEALVEEILHTLEPQVRAANARVSTDFAARPTLTYPRASLHTVLLNLLSNALKYADPTRPARIHCSLWLAAGEPVLWVKDNGVGFDAAGHGPELFQLFRRFHAHVEGTGVGLYLVNRLLLAKGGHLEVDSQVGAGATFRAYLGPA
ncbi:histidine kinase [Hymenobacter roseosalivarius DSM 11622]|uniref:histidine kinase n=2 Tax=Hymenobacter roseosalivarius TaxID=89967 RepID=A0A1W1W2K6_9BACT|nr:histidine kinase [Hymenobacter roseosalivarius DSM 11622]